MITINGNPYEGKPCLMEMSLLDKAQILKKIMELENERVRRYNTRHNVSYYDARLNDEMGVLKNERVEDRET